MGSSCFVESCLMEVDVKSLRNEHNIWEMEIMELKLQQQSTDNQLALLKNFLQIIKYRQEQMEIFMVKVSTNPLFIEQLGKKEEGSNGGFTSLSLPFPMPQLINGLGSDPHPFLRKIYEIVDDPNTDSIISWSSSGTSFFIWDVDKLKDLLPKLFNHGNISSFNATLNKYGFKKIDRYHCEYAHEEFQKDKKYLLKNIMSRKQLSAIMKKLVGDMEAELVELNADQNILKIEIPKLIQQQEGTKNNLADVKKGLQWTKFQQQLLELRQKKEVGSSSGVGGSTPSSLPFPMPKQKGLHRDDPPPNVSTLQAYTAKETRPWLVSTKFGNEANLEKLKKDMNQLEVEILNLVLKQEITENHLAAFKGPLQSAELKQQQMEISMDKNFRDPSFINKVIKQLKSKKEVDSGKIPKKQRKDGLTGQ